MIHVLWYTDRMLEAKITHTISPDAAYRVPADQAERERALDIRHSYLVQAPAGSGKTELLTQRALVCLAHVQKPEEVLVVTFTNKAVNEARARVLDALTLAASNEPPAAPHKRTTWKLARKVLERDRELGWNLARHPSRLRIMTIDKLNSSLAGQLPVLSGLGGPAQIEERAQLLYEEAVHKLFAELDNEALGADVRSSMEAVLGFARNRHDALTPFLVQLLKTRDQWLPVVRDADTFEMESVIHGLIETRLQGCLEAFTPRGLSQLLDILKRTPDDRFAFARPLAEWPDPAIENLPVWRNLLAAILTKNLDLRRKVTVKDGFPAKMPATADMNDYLEALHGSNPEVVARAAADVVLLPEPEYPETLDAFRVAVAQVLLHLVAQLRLVFEEHGQVDFTEVALRALAALGSPEEATEALLRQDYLIKHLLLDEGQDTSYSQYSLIEKLTSGWTPDDGRTLFIVGDPQQSIYAFRQAEVALFLGLWESGKINEITLERVTLTTNFRSDPSVVGWFNDTFRRIFPSKPDAYSSTVTFVPSIAHNDPIPGAAVEVHPLIDGQYLDEAREVVRLVSDTQTAHPEWKVAVLVRNRSHLKAILPAMRDAGIAYSCTDIDPLIGSPYVNDAACLVRALWHPMDRTAWVALLRAPFVGLSWADVLAITKGHPKTPIALRVKDETARTGLSEEGRARAWRFAEALTKVESDPTLSYSLRRKAESLWYTLGGPACVNESGAKDVRTLFDLLEAHCQGGELLSIEDFLNALDGLYASPDAGAVQVMTIHKAKGLEFDCVILPGLGEGGGRDNEPLLRFRSMPGGFLLAPHYGKAEEGSPEVRLYEYLARLQKQSQESETLRLLYVALTRAKAQMHLICQAKAPTAKSPWRAYSGSLLSYLWPVVQPAFAARSITPAIGGLPRPPVGIPVSPRLTLAWSAPALPESYLPAHDRADLPSERVIKSEHHGEADEFDNLAARLTGTMYHALMERISNDGLENWNEAKLNAQGQSLTSGFRRMGMPEPQVAGAVEEVLRLAALTLNCEHGRWVLKGRAWAKSEYEVAGYVEGKWTAASIDRCFEEDGTLVVVDYKTSGKGVTPDQVVAFMAAEAEKYAPQLDEYARVLKGLRKWDGPVKKVLYFPALQRRHVL